MSAVQSAKDTFINEVANRLAMERKNKIKFSDFLEEKMERFDYSNTSLAKKVYHRIERQDKVSYVPVTRQTIGSWLRGSMPSTREIYISLGMAFHMTLDEINYILLENYMGYGLYCKNIEDAIWIAVVNGLFDIQDFELVKEEIENIFTEEEDAPKRSLATTDLWVLLSEAGSPGQFYQIIRDYSDEFRDGVKKFGQCLDEVIEEEYGYYEKAALFLRDIGCLHCEAQFSKIRAGKAIVTREWLLRFCISLQPSLESIEKLLAKAQMEPLGITPMEVIIEMVAKYKSDTVANSHEIWMLIEQVAQTLQDMGYELDEELCRKYTAVYNLSVPQKWWFSFCVGRQILNNEMNKEFGYEKSGYCRHVMVDRLLFEDVNRFKKSAAFKKNASEIFTSEDSSWRKQNAQEIPTLTIEKGYESEILDLEKFDDYCYTRKPRRLTKEFGFNDIYYYCALLYSIWTGKCYRKGQEEQIVKQLKEEFALCGLEAEGLMEAISANLAADAQYDENYNLSSVIGRVYEMKESA